MISKFSVKKPYTVLVCVVLVLVLGVVSLTRMTTDLLPSMSLPYALVITTDVGASPEEVESDVTAPIEAAMATTSNIKNVTSMSYNSYSIVTLEYEQSTNMDSTIIEIQQKLDQLKGNWADTVGSPMIMQINPDMMPVLMASVDVDGMSQEEISDYVNQELSASLESIEGVASVTTTGALEENVQVTLDQDKIDALNEKIQDKIKEQFADAQSQLDDAKGQVESGQKAIEEGSGQLTGAVDEVLSKKSELYQTQKDLESNLTQLQTQKEMLENAISQLKQAYDGAVQIQQAIDALNQIKQSGNIEGQTGEIPSNGEMDAQTSEQIQAILQGLMQNQSPAVSEQLANLMEQFNGNIDQQIAALQAQLDTINATISSQGAAFAAMGVTLNTYQDIPAAITTLTDLLTQVNTGISTIQNALTQIEAGKVTMDDAITTLNSNAVLASLKMSSSLAQLETANASLQQAQTSLDSAKDQALDSADMNTVLSIDTLSGLLVAQNFSMPAGYVADGEENYLVRVGDKVESIDDLKNLVLIDLGMDGIEPITLADVAEVEIADNASESYSKVNGNPAVMISMEKQTGYSTGDVTNRLLAKFKSLEKSTDGLHLTVLMNQGVYIDMIVDSVVQNMILGAILAIFVLILFLKDFRPTLVITCSIPLSVIFAVVLMYFSNISLNIISMSGLALGIGMLVDNSIVVIENIYRLRNEGYSIRKAAVEGASQVTGAIIASTLTTVCVFAPIIFTEGITRQLFTDMALTIAFTLGASLLVALTLVPAMAAGLLKNTKEIKHGFLDKVKAGYAKLLRVALHFKPVVFLLAIVLLIGSTLAAFSRGMSFIDMDMETDQMTVTVEAKEDETLTFEELKAISDEVADKISTIDGIDTIGAMAGGNSTFSLMGSGSTDSVSMYLILDENRKNTTKEIAKEIEKRTKDLDCAISTDNSSMDMTAMFGSGVTVQIKGSDIDKLQEIAKQVTDVVEKTEGTCDVENGLDDNTPVFTISVDKEKAAEYGMTVAQVYQLVYAKMASNTSATTITTDIKNYDVFIKTQEQDEVTLDDIKNMTFTYTPKSASMDAGTGLSLGDEPVQGEGEDTKETEESEENEDGTQEIPLSEIATFTEGSTLSTIYRDSQTRYINVTAGIDETHNVTLVSNEIQKELDKLELPEGYSIKMTGEDETIAESMNQVYLMLLLAVIFIYLIMVAQFQSLLSPFIIMFTIPLAFTGGFFALFITGNEVSVIGMIGFVMLAGIIVNNGIVLIDYINQLRRGGMDKKEAIIEAGQTRLRPILMTALTTIISMSTMAVGVGSGSEMMQPMAIVTVGGLIYGTLLTLFVVPCIYDAFFRNKSMVEEEL
ncbi:MAG: efflux RND transporter permease subunit [Roseburia sp.]|uniref:efflux RND transporter permease subunit n=1 Tax=Roseburia sp. 831b TaxID=1261635 RepID=UPI000953060D|nr:efflux RND transporter permease subunit [Roseburia sp. 831b]MCI5919735.1 efflux RND transporter permease subunit [Roseburia sp.]WVK73259.1 efflux RND transporter permease subunit [Roseburia sp. 831b]